MNRFGISLLLLTVFLSCTTPAFAGMGDLQVTCEPGLRVFVDNVFKGISNESEGGLFISDLPPGPHTVKVIKKGLQPFEKAIMVKEFVAVEVVAKFSAAPEKVVPLPPERGEVAAPTGALALRSAPMGASVSIDGEKKTGKTDLRIENVKAGRHEISFQRDNQNLSGAFVVEPDKTLELKADFKNGMIVNISELKKSELEKGKARPEAKEEKAPPPVKDAVREPQQAKAEGKGGPVPQPVIISEAAKSYGELYLEVFVSRETPTFYRDSLVADFPDRAIPADHLLDSHFTDTRGLGDDIKYQAAPAGRSISCSNVIAPQQGHIAKTNAVSVSVKEGSYTMSVSRKRWKVDFFSDHSIFNKAAQENIVIKRGARLHIKIRYAPDKDEKYSIEKTYETIGSKFFENVDLLLLKKPSGRK
ncbi:MAG TPA: PEGA domain-containing protein [Nitrospirota bacterium]